MQTLIVNRLAICILDITFFVSSLNVELFTSEFNVVVLFTPTHVFCSCPHSKETTLVMIPFTTTTTTDFAMQSYAQKNCGAFYGHALHSQNKNNGIMTYVIVMRNIFLNFMLIMRKDLILPACCVDTLRCGVTDG